MSKKGVPDRSIVKDREDLSARIKNHFLRLSSDVEIRVPDTIFMTEGFGVVESEGGYTTLRFPGETMPHTEDK